MTGYDVVTVWTPRPNDLQWREDYIKLLDLQRRSVAMFTGHRHVIVTDQRSLDGGSCILHVPALEHLPLMKAMIGGAIGYLAAFEGDRRHAVLVDVDCLIARHLGPAFENDDFDLGLLRREDPIAPVNNGAMYVNARAFGKARAFFGRALDVCGTHWGADQEAISKVAAPVPSVERIEWRDEDEMRVAFLSMRTHGVVPKIKGARHYSDPYVVHFKGDTKEWAKEYAWRYILTDEAV